MHKGPVVDPGCIHLGHLQDKVHLTDLEITITDLNTSKLIVAFDVIRALFGEV